ncbi:MAG: hypothetical protein JKY23_00415 [Nitrospinaceae bacterium]|nr:hypothetical protein [Nitrospinaceae bacterium]
MVVVDDIDADDDDFVPEEDKCLTNTPSMEVVVEPHETVAAGDGLLDTRLDDMYRSVFRQFSTEHKAQAGLVDRCLEFLALSDFEARCQMEERAPQPQPQTDFAARCLVEYRAPQPPRVRMRTEADDIEIDTDTESE